MLVLAIVVGILSAIFVTLLLAFIGVLYDDPEQYGKDESNELKEIAREYYILKKDEHSATKNSQQSKST